MDRKRVAAIGVVIFAVALLVWVASSSLREPPVSANIPAGPNARTEDEPDH